MYVGCVGCIGCIWPGVGGLCLLGSVHHGDFCGGFTLEGLRAGSEEED